MLLGPHQELCWLCLNRKIFCLWLQNSSDPWTLVLSTCSALSIKHSLLKSLTIVSVGAGFSWLALNLCNLTVLLFLCIFILIMFVSLRHWQVNLQMVIQESYLLSTQDPITGSADMPGLSWLWRFREKIHLSSGEHILTTMGLSFQTISKHLLFDRRTRASCFLDVL